MEQSLKEHLYALIICGGAGTRLWPRSRQKTPKQFLPKFFGEKTLFTQTVERVSLLVPNEKIYVVTLGDYVDEIIQQGQFILPKNIIVEPVGKNTAMAVGFGAAYIKKADPEAVIMNFWSDAIIKENDLFVEKLILASEMAALKNYLVVIGLKPTFPHTGLGYIEVGEKFGDKRKEIYKVLSFKEKPNLETAKSFLAKGNYYWNTGILVWSAKAIFAAFSKYSPTIYSLLERISGSLGTASEREVIENAYCQAENVPIDVAVSEKADNLLLLPADFTWSDIGDWKVSYDLKDKDENGNVIETFGDQGWHLGEDTKNCLIETQNRLVATIGVSNLVVIETDDAVLICDKEKAQDVKKIVSFLREQKKDRYL